MLKIWDIKLKKFCAIIVHNSTIEKWKQFYLKKKLQNVLPHLLHHNRMKQVNKRENRIIVEMAETFIYSNFGIILDTMWAELISSAMCILNRIRKCSVEGASMYGNCGLRTNLE